MTGAQYPLPARYRVGPSPFGPGHAMPYGRGLLRPQIGPTDGLG